MSFRTILVYLDNLQRAELLITLTANLAEKYNSHLNGLYVVPPLQLYGTTDLPVPLEVVNNHRAYHEGLSTEISEEFIKATHNRNFVGEWRYISEGVMSPANAVAELAHTADLVILGKQNADAIRISDTGFVEQVLMKSSRPIIILPDNHKIDQIGRNIIVAWNGGNESTRAIYDSLPLLRDADNVVIHRINPASVERHQVLGTAAEMVNTLSRHGANVSLTQSEAHKGEIGEELMQYATEQGSDLLVMGAYGHSRLREHMIGGVTQTVLNDMTIPVLMSH